MEKLIMSIIFLLCTLAYISIVYFKNRVIKRLKFLLLIEREDNKKYKRMLENIKINFNIQNEKINLLEKIQNNTLTEKEIINYLIKNFDWKFNGQRLFNSRPFMQSSPLNFTLQKIKHNVKSEQIQEYYKDLFFCDEQE